MSSPHGDSQWQLLRRIFGWGNCNGKAIGAQADAYHVPADDDSLIRNLLKVQSVR